MTEVTIVVFIVGVLALQLGASYLDAKHQWRLVDWFSGACSNPFKTGVSSSSAPSSASESAVNSAIFTESSKPDQANAAKDQQIAELQERIQVLEKIINEPAYELNKKINAL